MFRYHAVTKLIYFVCRIGKAAEKLEKFYELPISISIIQNTPSLSNIFCLALSSVSSEL